MKNYGKKQLTIFSWALYDFANSAFATTISAVIFNVYFVTVVVGKNGASIFGINIPATALWGYTVSISMFFICLTAPILGAIADFSAAKKKFLFVYCYLACVFTGLLFFVKEGDYLFAVVFFILANIGFAGGNVFYNAFLPEIADKKDMGKISGWGWALGYLGGGVCLALNLVFIEKPSFFGLPEESHFPIRLSLLSVGIWWAVFSIPLFLWVKEKAIKKKLPPGENYFTIGFKRIKHTFQKVKQYRELSKFLVSYLIYNDGIQTVIVMAAVFAAEELSMNQGEVIKCFLLIQAVAFFGSLIFGYLADKLSSKKSISITLVVWSGVVIWAFFINTKIEFWILGIIVGLVLGGSQAASRSLLGVFVPLENAAEFFGFFAISGKFSSVIGPFMFAILLHIFGAVRVSMLALLSFFVIGGIILYFVNEQKGIVEGTQPIL